MKSLWAALAVLALACGSAAPSFAQAVSGAVVVATCGTPPVTYTAGSAKGITQDTTGTLCTAAGSGGGAVTNAGTFAVQVSNVPHTIVDSGTITVTDGAGALNVIVDSGAVAATVASGADVVEGTTADTSATSSVYGGILAIKANTAATALEATQLSVKSDLDALVAAAANPAAVTQSGPWTGVGVQGNAASGATSSGNPLGQGCRAATATPTAVTDGQNVNVQCTVGGRQVVAPYSIPENYTSGVTASMTGTTSTSLLAAPASGLRNYTTHIACVNSHATVGTLVDVQDGSGGTVLYVLAAAAVFGGSSYSLPTPLRQPTTATALFVVDETTGAAVKCSATGYQAP